MKHIEGEPQHLFEQLISQAEDRATRIIEKYAKEHPAMENNRDPQVRGVVLKRNK